MLRPGRSMRHNDCFEKSCSHVQPLLFTQIFTSIIRLQSLYDLLCAISEENMYQLEIHLKDIKLTRSRLGPWIFTPCWGSGKHPSISAPICVVGKTGKRYWKATRKSFRNSFLFWGAGKNWGHKNSPKNTPKFARYLQATARRYETQITPDTTL